MKTSSSCLYVLLVLGLLSGTTACSSPVTPAGAVTVTTAGPVAPLNGAKIANGAQPITLTINNGLVTDAAAGVTYTFEIATDSGFSNKVLTKDVPQTAGQTSVKLDTLAADRDYYWRVRTTGANTVGAFTSPLKFTIGPAMLISAPASQAPGT